VDYPAVGDASGELLDGFRGEDLALAIGGDDDVSSRDDVEVH
jgi:hypothetical protein